MLVKIQCPKCSWFKEGQDILDWYKKKCPKCKKCILIDRKDMDMYVRLKEKLKKGITIPVKKETPNSVEFDSSKLKEGFVCFKCGKKILKQFQSPLQKNVCIFCELGISKK